MRKEDQIKTDATLIAQLKEFGFHRHYTDPEIAPEDFYWLKKLQHPFLKGVEVIVTDAWISVECKSLQPDYAGKKVTIITEVTITTVETNYKNLFMIMEWIQTSNK
jgi:hypothetical protein